MWLYISNVIWGATGTDEINISSSSVEEENKHLKGWHNSSSYYRESQDGLSHPKQNILWRVQGDEVVATNSFFLMIDP